MSLTLRLILGDQLNPDHSWFNNVDPGVRYVMMEVRDETSYVLHHAQKIIAIFAAMRHFAQSLTACGHEVTYIQIDDPNNMHGIDRNLAWLIKQFQANALEYQAPDEWRLDQLMKSFCRTQSITCRMVDSEHFYTTREEAAVLFEGRKQWLMETFYRQMRIKHSVLLEEGKTPKPIGGKWNYDQENRKSWPGDPPEPPDPRVSHDHSSLWASIQQSKVISMGDPGANDLRWPLNREESLDLLGRFIQSSLPHFGDYQDAMSTKGWRLFHSLISFALNVKMLHPDEVVRAAENAHHNGTAPLSSVEGFIRQILGWREYIRGVYWANMPGYDKLNTFNHHRPLPAWFWTGDTQMNCMRHTIKQSLDHAYAHHIQRLMVTGNFALLAGLSPHEVHEWYLGIYIDAFEWVELPNTLGMSQFADGGRLATKPYVSSAAYIDRMSDYCKGCRYDKKLKTGNKACPFNALYWDFFDRHADMLKSNHRLGMVYRQLEKMDPEQRDAIRQQAAWTIEHLDSR